MSPDEIAAARIRFTRSDLRYARLHGEIAIAQTTLGTLTLSYQNGIYTLSTEGIAARVIAQGKPAVIVPILAAAYSVSVEC